MILFVITDETYVPRKDPLLEFEAVELLGGGTQRLSDEYMGLQFTSQHTADALVYEFALENDESEDPAIKLLRPSLVDGQTHLHKTDIGRALASTLENRELSWIFDE